MNVKETAVATKRNPHEGMEEQPDGMVVHTLDPVAQPMPEPVGGWPADQYTGVAGQYVRDPFTGVRRPATEPTL